MASSKKVKKVYVCPTCKGNGYVKVACIYEKEDMVHQCWDCDSSGELTIEEPTFEQLESMAASKRLQ